MALYNGVRGFTYDDIAEVHNRKRKTVLKYAKDFEIVDYYYLDRHTVWMKTLLPSWEAKAQLTITKRLQRPLTFISEKGYLEICRLANWYPLLVHQDHNELLNRRHTK